MEKLDKRMKKNQGLTNKQLVEAIYGKKIKECNIQCSSKTKVLGKPIKGKRVIQKKDYKLLLEIPYSMNQFASQMPTPKWFTSNQKVDVSFIVPLYKNSIENFVESWDFNCCGMNYEIIFVDDDCPINSKSKVLSSWEERKCEIVKPIGKIIQCSVRQGWGACCNIGSQYATGEILIFVHPEGKMFPNSICSLIDVVKKPEVGLVGGMHIDEESETIIECGSEFNWGKNSFLNIGSESFENAEIKNPFSLNDLPKSLLQKKDCEVVSGSMMAIKRNDFKYLGGFSPNLFTQIWSDADLCMRSLERNLKVIYEPNARMYRSFEIPKDEYFEHGSTYFHNKWISSKRIDNIISTKRIEVCKKVKNILIKRDASNGDVLIAASVAPALKKKYPDSKIIFCTSFPEVLEGNPWIDQITKDYSERQFDLLINLDMTYEYRPETNMLTAYAEESGVDESDCVLFLKSSFDKILPDNYVVIHAGKTNWAGRNWSTGKFDQISKKLKESGKTIICVGGPSDHKTSFCDFDFRGITSVYNLAHIIKNCDLFIGIDSFPMHVAQVFDKQGVVFFGSILPETRVISKNLSTVTAKNLNCLGCHHRKTLPCTSTTSCEIGIQECVNDVTVEMMWSEIKNKLNNNK